MLKKIFTLLLISVAFYACKENKKIVKEEVISPYTDLANKQFQEGRLDSAFINYSKAKEVYIDNKDTTNLAKTYLDLGLIAAMRGDNYGSQEILFENFSLLDTTNALHFPILASTNNTLGVVSTNLKNYKGASKYYEASLRFQTDSNNKLTTYNNIALSYRYLKEYKKSIEIFESIVNKPTHPLNNARILANLAFTKWFADSTYNPVPELTKALNIRIQEKDYLGQNSSYNQLSEYYRDKNHAKSLYYANEMLRMAEQLKHPDNKLDALNILINLSSPSQSKVYFDEYLKLNDSLSTARNADRNQFATIRYETEKIKTEKLLLEKDVDLKKDQLLKQRIITGSIAFILIVAIIISILWYRKRKQKLELEAENSIRENQLKTSKKVHDVVANGLYRVINEIENHTEIDREGILDRLEVMYDKSRDISYEDISDVNTNFHQKISDLVNSFSDSSRIIMLVGNSENLWKNLNANVKYELENIIQELLVNMKKHSGATKVTLKFAQKDSNIEVTYTDNGKGIADGTVFKNGLSSTENRIKNINGVITFDSQLEKGLNIFFSFPIH